MTEQLRVDPAACDGVGICAHLATDLIRVDTWGFPIVSREVLRSKTMRQARAAAAASPRRALLIIDK